MLAQMWAVETASNYFTRRARQERANAADAGSAQARKAHLELAVRLVRVAVEPALWAWPEGAIAQHQQADNVTDMGHALSSAFPLLHSASFESLLEALDTTDQARERSMRSSSNY